MIMQQHMTLDEVRAAVKAEVEEQGWGTLNDLRWAVARKHPAKAQYTAGSHQHTTGSLTERFCGQVYQVLIELAGSGMVRRFGKDERSPWGNSNDVYWGTPAEVEKARAARAAERESRLAGERAWVAVNERLARYGMQTLGIAQAPPVLGIEEWESLLSKLDSA